MKYKNIIKEIKLKNIEKNKRNIFRVNNKKYIIGLDISNHGKLYTVKMYKYYSCHSILYNSNYVYKHNDWIITSRIPEYISKNQYFKYLIEQYNKLNRKEKNES